MKKIVPSRSIRRIFSSQLRLVILLLTAFAVHADCFASADVSEPLFAAPPRPLQESDQVFLVSTRRIGVECNSRLMQTGLDCQQRVEPMTRNPVWLLSDWRRAIASDPRRSTIVYVHGNRVSSGYDKVEGMSVYRSFRKHHPNHPPVRFIIWSWPASQIPGPIKDYMVKAQRTNPAAWQLAWMLNRMPTGARVRLVGYSYGTRVVSGAAHLLAGGQIGSLRLQEPKRDRARPIRVALMAAAFDADWLQPDRQYSRAVSQMERAIIATNQLDPAMRFYHLSNGRGRMDALGKYGVHHIQSLGKAAHRLGRIDFTREVGRSHVVSDYLAANRQMHQLWHELLSDLEHIARANGGNTKAPVVLHSANTSMNR